MKLLSFVTILMLISACNSEQATPVLFEVEKQPFSIQLSAKGELFAAKATVISAPISRRGAQNIAWLAPDFSQVKKGDVIARFDGEAMQVESSNKENELAITSQEIIEKRGGLNKDLDAINKDIGVVKKEKIFAEKFTIEDDSIMSKLDIIDSLENSEYLGSKQEYLQWKGSSFSKSSDGQMGLLEMQKQQHQNKLDALASSLNQLEIKAPHDGLLSFKANWRGEKPRAGQSIWSGQKIAELPDISEMKAKLFVLESEAIELTAGQSVNLYLNAFIDQNFAGTIESVAPFPQSIKRGDPQKYFEVIVSLNQQNAKLFVPGKKLEAKIIVAESQDKLIVPLQSIYSKENETYVYLLQKEGVFQMKKVSLGRVSLSHVEILSGLEEGQFISVINMEKS
jgi:multidrug efflux pump subunit AcrA (membrane-fusion protein)